MLSYARSRIISLCSGVDLRMGRSLRLVQKICVEFQRNRPTGGDRRMGRSLRLVHLTLHTSDLVLRCCRRRGSRPERFIRDWRDGCLLQSRPSLSRPCRSRPPLLFVFALLALSESVFALLALSESVFALLALSESVSALSASLLFVSASHSFPSHVPASPQPISRFSGRIRSIRFPGCI